MEFANIRRSRASHYTPAQICSACSIPAPEPMTALVNFGEKTTIITTCQSRLHLSYDWYISDGKLQGDNHLDGSDLRPS